MMVLADGSVEPQASSGVATIKQVALVLTFTSSLVVASLAQTPEQQQACMDDAFKFCEREIPDRDRVFACLVQNSSVISPLCRSAVAPYVTQEPAAKQAAKRKVKAKRKAVKRANKGPVDLVPNAR